jgi:hypothetical protein
MEIFPVGAKSFHVDGQTDVAKLIVAFRNFANEPKDVNLFKFCFKSHTHNTLHEDLYTCTCKYTCISALI